MYCVKCGVKLADSEKQCPLCGTVPYHPEISAPEGESLYPVGKYPSSQVSPMGAKVIISAVVFLLPILITLVCDLQLNGMVTWSGYVVGGLLLAYVVVILPGWFRKPNPVVFVPCDFGALIVYLLYICIATHGKWFLSFAFPVTGGLGLIVTAVVTLLRYVRRGKLYIIGGASIALGLFMPVAELLMNITWHRPMLFIWSEYPLTALVLLGGLLIFLAICRPARETVERKFFI